MNKIVVQKLKSSTKSSKIFSAVAKNLPKSPGIYIYRNDLRKVIYVGKAVNLKNRVQSYFHPSIHSIGSGQAVLGTGNKGLDPKTQELVKNIARIDTIECGSEFEALVLEADLIKRYKPKYNIRFKDDKNYVYLKITKEKYPRITIVHQITEHEAEYIGPFIDTNAVRSILRLARKIFPYCTCALKGSEVCLYYHIGLCKGHGEKHTSETEYKKSITGIKKLFFGKVKILKSEFEKEMKKASRRQNYELASEFRDKLKYLSRIEKSHFISERDLSADKALFELKKELKLNSLPQKIECFDISNVMGTAATGSMIVFRNGIAVPRDYRRFQVKTVKGSNDVAMMAEVVARRFRGVVIARNPSALLRINSVTRQPSICHPELVSGSKEIPDQVRNDTGGRGDRAFSDLPDLVILDGGKGQLSAVLNKLQTLEGRSTRPGLERGGCKIVALAKKKEQMIVAENSKSQMTNNKQIQKSKKTNLEIKKYRTIELSRESEAMYLVQRIRDEAHRFAVSYHRKVKSREVFESSLDNIAGSGPKTKKKLIAKFGSMKNIKEANISEISKVVGEKLAKRIKEAL